MNVTATSDKEKGFKFTTIMNFHFIYFQKAELKQCDATTLLIRSANQLIFEYYYDITAAELKAYALVQLAYMFNTVYGRGIDNRFRISRFKTKLIQFS